MEENKIVEVSTEDKIAKLKATLEGMELLGATVPQAIKDAVAQELATLEEKLKAEAQRVGAELVSVKQNFIQKYGSGTAHAVEIILLAAILGKMFGRI
jgi:hypothetical protein